MTQITRRHSSREIARILSRSIRRGDVTAGSYLPPARELASHYGVSLNTVQIALRELETLELVQSIPRRGTLVKTPPAERGGRQLTQIAALVPVQRDHQQHTGVMRIIHGIETALFAAGSSLSILPCAVDKNEAKKAILNRLDRWAEQIKGVICFALPGMMGILKEIESRDVRWVSLGRPGPDIFHNFVAVDHHAAGRLVGRCFGRLRYERVAILSDDVACNHAALEKTTGFFQGRLETGCPMQGAELIKCPGCQQSDGYAAVKALLVGGGPMPRGIFATAETLGAGATQALNESDISVPEQVSVVVAGGLADENSTPGLSLIVQPFEELGRLAAKMLLEMIEGDIRRIAGRRVRGRFIAGQSLTTSDEIREEINRYQPVEDQYELESPVIKPLESVRSSH